jgi:predicted nucleotidyltransferase
MQEVVAQAKAIIDEVMEGAGYRVLRILLFGSRARGDARPDSDWDFFVITDREPTRAEKQAIQTELSLRFAPARFLRRCCPAVGRADGGSQGQHWVSHLLCTQGGGTRMNEEAVSLWIRRAESDLKIGKGSSRPKTLRPTLSAFICSSAPRST